MILQQNFTVALPLDGMISDCRLGMTSPKNIFHLFPQFVLDIIYRPHALKFGERHKAYTY